MTVGELLQKLKSHHPDKEVLVLVYGESEPYEATEIYDEHDSIIISAQ